MQQSIFVTLLSSLILLCLFIYWIYSEIVYIYKMNLADMDISWIFQAPLMLFLFFSILILSLLLITTINEFNFNKFKKEINWKILFGTIILFDIAVLILTLIFEHLDIHNKIISQIIVVTLFLISYRYVSIKNNINFILFLITLLIVSATILYTIFEIIL